MKNLIRKIYDKIRRKPLLVKPVVSTSYNGWISVKDKYPEKDEFTLISYGGRVPLIGCYKGKGTWLGADSDFWTAKEEIRWWMPLPVNPSVG
jgi:hypothetical protein